MAAISLRGIRKTYGDGPEIVKGLDLDIHDGEFMVFVGPSGCGKSTLLRLIAGLEEITSGTLDIGGRCVNDLPPKERSIAMVFQSYALFPHMTVFENMAFGLSLALIAVLYLPLRDHAARWVLGRRELDRARLAKMLQGV